MHELPDLFFSLSGIPGKHDLTGPHRRTEKQDQRLREMQGVLQDLLAYHSPLEKSRTPLLPEPRNDEPAQIIVARKVLPKTLIPRESSEQLCAGFLGLIPFAFKF
jgi:hypothetical protein